MSQQNKKRDAYCISFLLFSGIKIHRFLCVYIVCWRKAIGILGRNDSTLHLDGLSERYIYLMLKKVKMKHVNGFAHSCNWR